MNGTHWLNRAASLMAITLFLVPLGCGGGGSGDAEVPTPGQNAGNSSPSAPEGQSEPKDAASDAPDNESDSKPQTDPVVNVEAEITLADWDAVQEMVKSHKGKVVVVDLWALTCIPCRREFPHLVKLSKSHAENVVCISVCCDFLDPEFKSLDEIKPTALKFLSQQGADFQNVLMKTPQPDFFEKIELGSLPAIYVYDQTGQEVTRLDNDVPEFSENGFTYEDHVVPLVDKLIAEK